MEKDISQQIRNLRTSLGLTQEQFAAKLGVTFPTINRWENKKTRPSPLAQKQIDKILKKLQKSDTLQCEEGL